MSSKVTTHISKAIDRNKIVCSLSVGEHLKRIQGLDYFKNAYDYEVNGEYPYLYLIRIKYRTGWETPVNRVLTKNHKSLLRIKEC